MNYPYVWLYTKVKSVVLSQCKKYKAVFSGRKSKHKVVKLEKMIYTYTFKSASMSSSTTIWRRSVSGAARIVCHRGLTRGSVKFETSDEMAILGTNGATAAMCSSQPVFMNDEALALLVQCLCICNYILKVFFIYTLTCSFFFFSTKAFKSNT